MNYQDCAAVGGALGLKIEQADKGYLIEDYKSPGLMLPVPNLAELRQRVINSATFTASVARRS